MTEFDDVIQRLREERPQATPLELDQIKQRALRQAARPSRRTQDMKSRLAILAMLVFGMLLSTTGAGLAVQGLTGSDDAGIAQYGPGAEEDVDGGGDVAGEQEESGLGGGSDTVAGAQDTPPLQETRQAESGAGGELPFTGFLAIPVLLGGLALLSAGLVLRRRSDA